ncbi:MAG: S16 family serine protease [Eubacteriales bacterium]|nr:S16 family serine protease [Eubacteriales bacterium]
MIYTAVMLLQLAVTLIMGMYFYRQLKNTRDTSAPQKGSYSRSEQDRLTKLRSIRLSEPLAEQARPDRLEDVIGQEDGIRALRALLCGAHPQHVLIYGPPGVGKTCAARLMLEEAKRSEGTPFRQNAPFIEVDATCVRFDERSIADPLIGSVHDPIYQGAGPLGINGIPQPREGAVTKAHGGVLFLDEIGEMQPIQMNKLLKVLEDRKVRLESAYYDPDDRRTPSYIHDIFKNGLPADFRLVAATTRSPEEIPSALRSRCMEVYFRALEPEELARIASHAAERLGCEIAQEEALVVGMAAGCGRDAVNIVQMAVSAAAAEGRRQLLRADVEWVMESCGYAPRSRQERPEGSVCGRVCGLAVYGTHQGALLRIDATVAPGTGRILLTGAVGEEELGSGRGRTIRRRGMAVDAAGKAAALLRAKGILTDDIDVHIDFPGGTPVDGPSAGLAMCIAAISAIRRLPVRGDVAMTGEIGLQGDVLPVGGVGRKIEAAQRAGCDTVLIPRANWQETYREKELRIVPVEDLQEALSYVFLQEKEMLYAPEQKPFAAENIVAQGAEGLLQGVQSADDRSFRVK